MPGSLTNSRGTAQGVMKAVRQLPPQELARFARHFQAWHGQQSEADLLAKIADYSQLPGNRQARLEELRDKLDRRKLSAAELSEYQPLLQELEARNVQRVEALIALANLRGTTVSTCLRTIPCS